MVIINRKILAKGANENKMTYCIWYTCLQTITFWYSHHYTICPLYLPDLALARGNRFKLEFSFLYCNVIIRRYMCDVFRVRFWISNACVMATQQDHFEHVSYLRDIMTGSEVSVRQVITKFVYSRDGAFGCLIFYHLYDCSLHIFAMYPLVFYAFRWWRSNPVFVTVLVK